MKKCPFCAEEIQDEAIKCRFCHELLPEGQVHVTSVKPREWKKVVALESNGSPRSFLDAIAEAAQAAGLPVVDRDYANLSLTFESKGVTWKSWAGDITVVIVAADDNGSVATFTSKTKPSGVLRVEQSVNARTWVTRLIPGFGLAWKGPPMPTTNFQDV